MTHPDPAKLREYIAEQEAEIAKLDHLRDYLDDQSDQVYRELMRKRDQLAAVRAKFEGATP